MNTIEDRKETIQKTEIKLEGDPIPTKMPPQERIRIFANIIVDRILELQKNEKLQEELKKM